MKVYGPYSQKDGRLIVIHYDGHVRRTQSYPRYLMELYLGRKLESWEEVDHINGDITDNRIGNFQLLTKSENVKKSAKRKKMLYFVCPICQADFQLDERTYKHNQLKQKRAGPYCSRSCAGKANSSK